RTWARRAASSAAVSCAHAVTDGAAKNTRRITAPTDFGRRQFLACGLREDCSHFNNLVTNCAPNAGSRITVHRVPTPPFPPANARELSQMQGDEILRDPTKRILIVEDNELNLKLLRDVLEAYGYETITTDQGQASLPLAREHLPDLILMDLQ